MSARLNIPRTGEWWLVETGEKQAMPMRYVNADLWFCPSGETKTVKAAEILHRCHSPSLPHEAEKAFWGTVKLWERVRSPWGVENVQRK